MKTAAARRAALAIVGMVIGLLARTSTAMAATIEINAMRRKLWGILLLLQVFWMPALHAAAYSGGSAETMWYNDRTASSAKETRQGSIPSIAPAKRCLRNA